MPKTAILLSGGQDSIALAYWKRPELAITIDYGQMCAEAELRASAHVCTELQIEHQVLALDCRILGSGDLAGKRPATVAPASDWWPFRNQLLVTLAGMKLLSFGITAIAIGCVKSDNQHADGTSEFVHRISALTSMQEGGICVTAPAIAMTTVDLIRISRVPIELLAWAHSCHTSNWACGRCRGCNKHREVMEIIGCGSY